MVHTLVSYLGSVFGYIFDENRGSGYFRASAFYDWKRETATKHPLAGAQRRYENDLGGTWARFWLTGPTASMSRYTPTGPYDINRVSRPKSLAGERGTALGFVTARCTGSEEAERPFRLLPSPVRSSLF